MLYSKDMRWKKIQAVKGVSDILPDEIPYWQRIEQVVRETMRLFNYREIRTPIFEETGLFARSIGEDTDIVGKEMYTFTDMGERSLTLRPEGTAPVVRAFIEHSLEQQGLPQKLWYMGPMFRQERPQKGRHRQFHQFGVEAVRFTVTVSRCRGDETVRYHCGKSRSEQQGVHAQLSRRR